jgi:outer membrane protein assembly factor BamD (BamD/ComL family)
MKRAVLISGLLLFALIGSAASASAQGTSRGPDASTLRDAELERDSKHNLEVARHYYRLRKAYRAAIARCEEVIAGNPTFSRIDEVLYIAGMSSLKLSENRAKQIATETPEGLREKARGHFELLIAEFPDSEFREPAEKELHAMGIEPKPKSEEKKP